MAGTALTLLLVAACARPAPQLAAASDADIAAVARVLATVDSCDRTHALDVLMGLMTDDVAGLFADQPALVGKNAAREFYRGLYGALAIDGRHEPLETHAVGDLVASRGNYRGTLTPVAGGQPTSADNKYLILFRRQADGSLKLWRAAGSSNVPPASPPAIRK